MRIRKVGKGRGDSRGNWTLGYMCLWVWVENMCWSLVGCLCLGYWNWFFGIGESIQVTLATSRWTRLFDIPSVSICLSVMHTA